MPSSFAKGNTKPNPGGPGDKYSGQGSKAASPEETTIRIASHLNHQTYFIGGIKVHFPFKPYPSQLGMMNHMIRALNTSKNTMIESPTGSGKSLALLCAALAWRRNYTTKNKQRVSNVRQAIRRYIKGGSLLPEADNKGQDKDAKAQVTSSEDTKPDVKMEIDSSAALTGGSILDKLAGDGHTDSTPALDIKPKIENSDITPDDRNNINNGDGDGDDDDDFVDATLKPKLSAAEKQSTGPEPIPGLPAPGSVAMDDPKHPKIHIDNTEILLIHALHDLAGTAEFIIQAAKTRMPPGMDQQDIDALIEFKENGSTESTPRIYFGSRTHRQVSQLVDELRLKSAYRLQTAVLGSRTQMCIHGEAIKTGSIDDACRKLIETDDCGPYRSHRKISGHPKVRFGGELEIWDIEDIVKLGKQQFACPYFAARELADNADLVFCPYNYILDPGVREAAGILLDGSIVILDEAHNVENAAREAGSVEITDNQLLILIGECQAMSKAGHIPETHQFVGQFAESLLTWLQEDFDDYEHQDFETLTAVWPRKGASIHDLLNQLAMTPAFTVRLQQAYSKLEDFIKEQRTIHADNQRMASGGALGKNGRGGELLDDIDSDSSHLSNISMRVVSSLLRVLKHLSHGGRYSSDYRVARIRRTAMTTEPLLANRKRKKSITPAAGTQEQVNTLAFWALNPGVVFSEIASQTRSIVLTSGTLSPLGSYASELQVDFASTLEANHVIDPSRFKAMSIMCGPAGTMLEAKYKTVDTMLFQDDVGASLCSIAASCPDGMLVFVSSYSLLNKLFMRWRTTKLMDRLEGCKRVFVEPQGGSKEAFEKLLNEYRNSLVENRVQGQPLERGAVMFAVYRGKVSEGIDFSDFFCRTVVNIGIPYPAFKDVKVTLKREYNDTMAKQQPRRQQQQQQPHSSTPGQQSSAALLNGSAWYEIQAFRATNQALGRCLRHKNDWGAIIMLESRFANEWNVNKLSKWVRSHMRVYSNFNRALADLDDFYRIRAAEDMAAHSPGDNLLATDSGHSADAVTTKLESSDSE
ncbi:hypothetical protein LPJ53_000868 [Coemansia erecta]|uniref:Regulator of telomere elongation helicase 1 homolog n=1 Tax=Coemansia erecta TaxID=147472 RepID=A0A9W7Y5I7_9FUNG|nr:hypothetical protein LPJ53_000868 [Coemansia erecta]